MKPAAKADVAVSTCMARSGCSSSEMFVADLHKKIDGSCSRKAAPSRVFAETRNENAFKETVRYRVAVELHALE